MEKKNIVFITIFSLIFIFSCYMMVYIFSHRNDDKKPASNDVTKIITGSIKSTSNAGLTIKENEENNNLKTFEEVALGTSAFMDNTKEEIEFKDINIRYYINFKHELILDHNGDVKTFEIDGNVKKIIIIGNSLIAISDNGLYYGELDNNNLKDLKKMTVYNDKEKKEESIDNILEIGTYKVVSMDSGVINNYYIKTESNIYYDVKISDSVIINKTLNDDYPVAYIYKIDKKCNNTGYFINNTGDLLYGKIDSINGIDFYNYVTNDDGKINIKSSIYSPSDGKVFIIDKDNYLYVFDYNSNINKSNKINLKKYSEKVVSKIHYLYEKEKYNLIVFEYDDGSNTTIHFNDGMLLINGLSN